MNLSDLLPAQSRAMPGFYRHFIGPTLMDKMAVTVPLAGVTGMAKSTLPGKLLKTFTLPSGEVVTGRKAIGRLLRGAQAQAGAAGVRLPASRPALPSRAAVPPPSTPHPPPNASAPTPPTIPPPAATPPPAAPPPPPTGPAASTAPAAAAPAAAAAAKEPGKLNLALMAMLGLGGYGVGSNVMSGLRTEYGLEQQAQEKADIAKMMADLAAQSQEAKAWQAQAKGL